MQALLPYALYCPSVWFLFPLRARTGPQLIVFVAFAQEKMWSVWHGAQCFEVEERIGDFAAARNSYALADTSALILRNRDAACRWV